MQFCDNKADKKFNLGIDRYDILILLLETFKMRYYMPLYSKIYIWPISGDCPFLSGQKNGSGWSKKLAHKMFVFLGPLRAITTKNSVFATGCVMDLQEVSYRISDSLTRL